MSAVSFALQVLLCAVRMNAQQPFITDDADIARKGHFHFELISEFDGLQRNAYPAVRQSTSRVQMTYGLTKELELGFDAPLLWIGNSRSAGIPNALGFGDLDLQMKVRLRRESQGSRWPAVTFGFYVEVPTGDTRRQLGSGLADYWLNGIVQKTITRRLIIRMNSGVLFSGNTLTGAIGVRSTQGKVFTGASSLTYRVTDRLLVGTEIAGALTQQFDLGKGQLQLLGGAKLALSDLLGLDFALTGGKFEGSPRIGCAVGISVDF